MQKTYCEFCGSGPECGVCGRGKLVADLETDWRGELKEANVYAEQWAEGAAYPVVKVTGLNPRGPIFAGVFAE